MRSKGKGKRELKGLLEGLDVGKRKRILVPVINDPIIIPSEGDQEKMRRE
jgi:hypothetical protein